MPTDQEQALCEAVSPSKLMQFTREAWYRVTLTLDELQKFLKDKLGKHEMVQALEIRDDLPRTPVGKISKKDLYDQEERKSTAA